MSRSLPVLRALLHAAVQHAVEHLFHVGWGNFRARNVLSGSNVASALGSRRLRRRVLGSVCATVADARVAVAACRKNWAARVA
eukprot:11578358-Alexandrium_andersonii.AAC.1